jgi:acetyltransferase-like isoleucine patch superfamily enzyme
VGFVGNLRRKLRGEISPISVGRHTYGHQEAAIFKPSAGAPLKVGSFCSIGDGVTFLCDANHSLDAATTFPIHRLLKNERHEHARKRGIAVGNDVWIGFSATILPGVTIADGAIIGTGSIVTRDVPPYAIVAGNPATLIRFRFSQNVINDLLRIKWWDWNDSQVIEAADLLAGPIEQFVAKYALTLSASDAAR